MSIQYSTFTPHLLPHTHTYTHTHTEYVLADHCNEYQCALATVIVDLQPVCTTINMYYSLTQENVESVLAPQAKYCPKQIDVYLYAFPIGIKAKLKIMTKILIYQIISARAYQNIQYLALICLEIKLKNPGVTSKLAILFQQKKKLYFISCLLLFQSAYSTSHCKNYDRSQD